MRPPAFGHILLFLMLLLASSACSPKQTPAQADFNAPDTAGRVPAIVGAADREDPQSLQSLVRALSDEDPAVRLFAIQSLEKRTGQSFGYRYYDAEDKRQAAIADWQAWLDNESGSEAAAVVETNP